MKHTEYIIPIGEDAQDYDEMFIGVIRRQPELVRCKDCKYSHKCGGDMMMRSTSGGYIYCPLGADGYCSMGERKEE